MTTKLTRLLQLVMICCLLTQDATQCNPVQHSVRTNDLPSLASDTHHCSLTISTIFPLFFFASMYSCASLQSDSLNCLSIMGFISPVENLSPAKDVKLATMVSLNCLGRARIVLPMICSLLPKHCSQHISSAKINAYLPCICPLLDTKTWQHSKIKGTASCLQVMSSCCCASRRKCTTALGKCAVLTAATHADRVSHIRLPASHHSGAGTATHDWLYNTA